MRIIVTGGGTGGHIYPILAFLRYLKKVEPHSEILYIGTKQGLESKIVPEAGFHLATIDIQGLKRSLSPENLKTAVKFLTASREAKRLIRDFKPDIVLGTGGYVSAPVVYAATQLKLPTVIHEQNVLPGIANKFLARRVSRVAVAFQAAIANFPKGKAVFTGNPRAQEIAELKVDHILEDFGLSPDKPTVVVFGGSRGALTLNKAFVAALPELAKQDWQTVYASGEIYYEDYRRDFEKFSKNKNLVIRPYISNMTELLTASNLVVARSGATTIAEVTALGIPAIFVPSPNVTADQQTKNAQALVDKGAASLIADSDLTAELLLQSISDILGNVVKYNKMHQASLLEGVPDASKRLYKLMKELIKN